MIARSLKDFFLVVKMQNRQAWYHKKAAVSMILLWSVRIGLTIALYSGIYKMTGNKTISATSLPVAISSMLFYAIFSGFGNRDIYRTINSEYKSGAMEIWLNKPISYLILKSGENIGKNIPIACGLIACSAAYWLIKGLPDIDHLVIRFMAGTFLLFMGIIIGYILYAIIGLSAVWLQDASAFFLIFDKAIMIFGGIYIPISFFPGLMRSIGEALPTTAALFVSQIFYADFFNNLPRFVFLQFFWLLCLSIILHRMNASAKRHLTVNGG